MAGPPGLQRAQLQRAFEVPQFHAEPRQRCKCVDDESTPVAGVVIALVGILVSESAVDPDRVSDPFVLSPSVGLARFRVRVR